MLIGLSGRKGSGKDTAALYLCSKYNFKSIAFADPLKESCQILFGFSHEQLYDLAHKETLDPYWNVTPRKIYQFLGTEVFRGSIQQVIPGIGEDFWVRSTMQKLKHITSRTKLDKVNVVITDVRFQNELDAIRNEGGFIIKLVRNICISNSEDQHSSESIVDNLESDIVIENNSTLESLYESIDQFVSLYFVSTKNDVTNQV